MQNYQLKLLRIVLGQKITWQTEFQWHFSNAKLLFAIAVGEPNAIFLRLFKCLKRNVMQAFLFEFKCNPFELSLVLLKYKYFHNQSFFPLLGVLENTTRLTIAVKDTTTSLSDPSVVSAPAFRAIWIEHSVGYFVGSDGCLLTVTWPFRTHHWFGCAQFSLWNRVHQCVKY